MKFNQSIERDRLKEKDSKGNYTWKMWDPYVSERQSGTVREDYRSDGQAWQYFPHDHARSKALRWGEDSIAGVCDDHQHLCMGLAMWNGKDAILKERLFGLANHEANHGEDVKELYYYLDAPPSHSYLKMLYKYPQCEFPYSDLVKTNGERGFEDPAYELIDTGVFDQYRYYDIVVESAKDDPEGILMRITATNRGPDTETIHLLPQVWYRNTWSWSDGTSIPKITVDSHDHASLSHQTLGEYHVYSFDDAKLICYENETNVMRHGGGEAPEPFKDGFHDYVINHQDKAISATGTGTKIGALKQFSVRAGESAVMELRLSRQPHAQPSLDFDEILQARKTDADQFYAELQSDISNPDACSVQRQAYGGMIWTKQFYHYEIREWLNGDDHGPTSTAERKAGRNSEWFHLNNEDIISMPDKWEYPWYAVWDLAFHCLPLAYLDPDFAKGQLMLMTREWYMHPNDQIPAYEWNFGDVNPPVHAWATWRVYQIDKKLNGQGDRQFLESVFHKLMLNFTWWVNRKDASGRNVFQGGFLGSDNIGVFDRSAELPTGGYINQSDGTSWMAMFSLNLMTMALELAQQNPVYESIATKFFEHFLYIAEAMTNIGGDGTGLWDEEDKFYYDVLNLPNGKAQPLRVRSLVGLIPLFAVETLEPEMLKRVPEFAARLESFLEDRPDLAELVSHWNVEGSGHRRLLSLLRGSRMKSLLKRMLDEDEFLSPYGIRSLSLHYRDSPYCYNWQGNCLDVTYVPAESANCMFGGNSNWRGPVWFPVNYLLIESLQKFHHYYGDDFRIEHPTGSENYLSIKEVADERSERITRLFMKDAQGHRPVYNNYPKMEQDPHFSDHILFYEYFHGDNGRGAGASHQTGWTGLVAKLIQQGACANSDPKP